MIRRSVHADSWYNGNPRKLEAQIENWVSNVPDNIDISKNKESLTTKGLIAPHAGYTYCGPVMSYSYKYVDTKNIKKIFILGPSHRVYIKGCALPRFNVYECPLGDIPVDETICEELEKTGLFTKLSKNAEEEEHSIEMQLPFTSWIMKNQPYTIIPIVFGSVSQSLEAEYVNVLKKYVTQPDTFFIISSDFCHWGSRFDYTYLPQSVDASKPIYSAIEALDREAMEAIEGGSEAEFKKYLDKTSNTICGRTGICMLLSLFKESGVLPTIKFLKYDQSNKVTSMSDCSVSYATAIISI